MTIDELRTLFDYDRWANRRLWEAVAGLPPEATDRQGQAFALPLGPLMQHLTNHGTHHRSEVATMLTMLGVSPPPTDLVVYHLVRSGQMV